jgi:hypothetical protein
MNWTALFPTQALANSARSTVLHSLTWMMLLLFAGLIAAVIARAPGWLLIVLTIMQVLNFFLFYGAYIYFAGKDPERCDPNNMQFEDSKSSTE